MLGFKTRQSLLNYQARSKAFDDVLTVAKSRCEEYYYTLLEMHSLTPDGARVENRLFRSPENSTLGVRTDVSELYPKLPEDFTYTGIDRPMFAYFRPAIANNLDSDTPLGLPVFANCIDTLKALDVVFDSFCREFILGKKRIIVPSSCVRTVVDPETGKVSRYFDTDDEVYQALKCDEEKDLKISDNTTQIRAAEHIDSINALLNILCFQTGLSPGTLSFDGASGVKTATEVVSLNSKSARTVRAHKNMLSEAMCSAVRSLVSLGGFLGSARIPANYDVSVSFPDNIIEDDKSIMEKNILLTGAGLRSKVSAIMEICGCDEETARRELMRIREENSEELAGDTELQKFDPSEG